MGRKVDGDEKKMVWLYPLSFFFRRAIFILSTVFLMGKPAMSMIIHQILTVATIVFISYNNQMFTTKSQRFIEVASEMLLLFVSILL